MCIRCCGTYHLPSTRLILSSAEGNAAKGAGSLKALDVKTGETKASVVIGAQFRSPPTVVDGIVNVSNGDGNLYAVDFQLNSKPCSRPIIWSFKTDGQILASPAVADGVAG